MQDKNLFFTYDELNAHILDQYPGEKIGFVPTMGALHEGHLSLIELASQNADLVVVNIFVNPTQFNNQIDLEKYPRTLDLDVALIHESFPNVLIVAPSFDEVYPPNLIFPDLDLNGLDTVMEGEFRPGHFKGVCHVVYNLFELVKPAIAFFGAKDFQQVAIIRFMVKTLGLNVKIQIGDTVRNESGLALSSRNQRLSSKEKEDALVIFQTLHFIKENISNYNPNELLKEARHLFHNSNLKLEYLQLVNSDTLMPIDHWDQPVHCCIAAFCGEVRLIDNMQIVE
jgi:pantoate--beta-alanine ligase